jgi:hypothetical protein
MRIRSGDSDGLGRAQVAIRAGDSERPRGLGMQGMRGGWVGWWKDGRVVAAVGAVGAVGGWVENSRRACVRGGRWG